MKPKQLILNDFTATGPRTIAAGGYSVGIANVGAANGVVNGNEIVPNETVNYQAPACTNDSQQYVLPRIEIDGTGTTLKVTAIYYP